MYTDLNRCPMCRSPHYTVTRITDGRGYTALVTSEVGSICLHICRACGAVYIPKNTLDGINMYHAHKEGKV